MPTTTARFLRALPLALAALLGAYAVVVTAGVLGALLLLAIVLFAGALVAWVRAADATARAVVDRTATGALLCVPALLTAFFSFASGGFFPDSVALGDIVVTVLLLIRLGLVEGSLARLGRRALVPLAGLAGFATWALLSQFWSHAPGRATIAFDRDLLYALTFALFATVGATRARLAWALRALAAVMAAIAAVSLLSRVAPDILVTAPDSAARGRLAYPLTYWNSLGAFCAIAAVLCLHLASSDERRVVRVLSAGALPVIGATLLLTYSRGALVVAAIGLLAYAVLGRPRGLVSALIATAPATAIAMKVSYDATLISDGTAVTPAAVHQGHHLGLAVLGCVAVALVLRVALLRLDRLLEGRRSPIDRHRRKLIRLAWAAAAIAILASVALGAPGAVANRWDQFVNQQYAPTTNLTRNRLSSAANGGRIALWDIEFNSFNSHPFEGTGADTFEILYYEHRQTNAAIVNAHSLFVETLGDLGLVGLILVMVFVLGTLVGVAPARRGRDRALYAALFSAGLAWALHTGVDWDWQMPAASLWFAALGGLALGRPDWVGGSRPRLASVRALVAGAALLGVAVFPVLVLASEVRLNEATSAYAAGNCTRALRLAHSSIDVLGTRAPPWQIVALCDIRNGQLHHAEQALRAGLAVDPQDWELQAALAATTAALGSDARAQVAVALRLDPLDAGVQILAQSLAGGPSAKARAAGNAFLSQQTLIVSG